MKTSIAHLPQESQDRLKELVEYIKQNVPETEYIILYGSYARGDQVEYDQRTEFGLRTCFMSDFDIVVLTEKSNNSSVMRRLENASSRYAPGYNMLIKPTVQFLAMNIGKFNTGIRQGRYFYTDIRKEGIILFNNDNHEIEDIKELNYQQIYDLSQEYFEEKYSRAESFLYLARAASGIKDYRMASFQLHQAVENYLLSLILTSSLYSPKEHCITTMVKQSTLFTPVAAEIFHTRTTEEEHLLELLQKAYIQARYNKDFMVTQEDIEALLLKVEQLRTETDRVCREKIKEHNLKR